MISEKILAIFDFIDYLNSKKQEYLEKYLPLCNELSDLGDKRGQLQPRNNYKDKLQHRTVQTEISEKFTPITEEIYKPVVNKMLELGIWSGDDAMASIWNNNFPAIADFKENFQSDDIQQVMTYKKKYLDFRSETNSNFLSLQMVFSSLDEMLKPLFDFFKDTDKNEFDLFEAKTIEVDTLQEAVKGMIKNKGKNVKYSIPHSAFTSKASSSRVPFRSTNIQNIYNMGDTLNVGNISGNSGEIIIGKDIKISESFNDRKETLDKINEVIELIGQENNYSYEQKQSLISNFENVKAELLKAQADKSRIYKWLSNTKEILENMIFVHHVVKAVNWVYYNLNFVISQLKG
jgi:hypothetical protein